MHKFSVGAKMLMIPSPRCVFVARVRGVRSRCLGESTRDVKILLRGVWS